MDANLGLGHISSLRILYTIQKHLMKPSIFFVFLPFCNSYHLENATAQWTPTTGPGPIPYVGSVSSFAAFGGKLYAGSVSHGVFATSDTGRSWTSVSAGMTKPFVSALVVSGNTLIAGIGETGGGILLSSDGVSWEARINKRIG